LRRVTRKTLDYFVTDWARGGPMFEQRLQLAQEREGARAAAAGRPARKVRLGRSAKTISNRSAEERMRPLNATELRVLVEAAEGQFARTLLVTAAMTGMRHGELLGLRWRDVDYTNRRVWVRRSTGLGGAVKQPKTAKSVRAIALPRMVADELEEHWKRAPQFRGADDYVFASSTGTPLDGRNMVREVFEP